MTRIANLALELRRRVEKHPDKMVKNEVLIRYALVDPRVPAEAEAGEDSPQEIEAAYLSRLFLSLSRLSTVTIREAMSYSRIWRPLMSVRFGARYALLGKDEKIDREAI